jgi:hypothetical protein
MALKVSTKNQTAKEESVKSILEDVLSKYKAPIITSEILIEEKSIPHSHPVLTLNTRHTEPLLILKKFIHEQLHWFVQDKPNYEECITFLKKYRDLGDCNKSGKYPNSFWEHLIVCWNTRNFLQQTLEKEKVNFIYNPGQVYPLTEKFVEENFEILQKDLEGWNMIYPIQ